MLSNILITFIWLVLGFTFFYISVTLVDSLIGNKKLKELMKVVFIILLTWGLISLSKFFDDRFSLFMDDYL